MKMIVSDYDDTFYTTKEETEKNLKASKKFMNDGNLFVIATGRSYSQIQREIKRLKIRYSYLICNDGALIFNHKSEVLYRKDMNPSDVIKIVDMIKDDKNIIRWYIDDGEGRSIDSSSVANGIIIQAITRDKATEILDTINNEVKGAHGYLSTNYINITDKSVSKANGITKLNEYLKVKKENIYPIGNDINDISMIESYDGFIVKGASDRMQKYRNKEIGSVYELIDKLRAQNS